MEDTYSKIYETLNTYSYIAKCLGNHRNPIQHLKINVSNTRLNTNPRRPVTAEKSLLDFKLPDRGEGVRVRMAHNTWLPATPLTPT